MDQFLNFLLTYINLFTESLKTDSKTYNRPTINNQKDEKSKDRL